MPSHSWDIGQIVFPSDSDVTKGLFHKLQHIFCWMASSRYSQSFERVTSYFFILSLGEQ